MVNLIQSEDIAGVVLAGGKSSRMGNDKSLLIYQNKTLLEHAENILINTGIKHVIVSAKHSVKDTYIEKGPISGIFTCLSHLKSYKFVLFIPVDMPKLTKQTILNLCQSTQSIIHYENQQFPLLISNKSRVRTIIEKQILADNLSIRNLFKVLNSQVIENHLSNDIFFNSNTPQQWNEFLKSPFLSD